MTDERLLLLSSHDNVFVLREPVREGDVLAIEDGTVTLPRTLDRGHKIARFALQPGDKVLKYGAPIGSATQPVAVGEHVHVHNIKSDYTATHIIERKDTEQAP